MNLFLHQTQITIGDFEKRLEQVKQLLCSPKNEDKELHLFPELYLSGYPLQDLCLQKIFYSKYISLLKEIDSFSQSLPDNPGRQVLLGGLSYQLSENKVPIKIENVIFQLSPGKPLKQIYSKQLLPNYDIFDEKKYFKPGDKQGVIEIHDHIIGLLICEDMWPSESHRIDPSALLHAHIKNQNIELDLIVNLSASPYGIDKLDQRKKRAQYISEAFGCPFVYVNQCSGEDEILFDGGSFLVDQKKFEQAALFKPDIKKICWSKPENIVLSTYQTPKTHIWESLFEPELDFSSKLPSIPNWTQEQLESFTQAICFGLQQYAQKSGFKKFLVALSGGIDSAMVLALAKHSLGPGQELEALYMPSRFSSDLSLECVKEQCKSLNIDLKIHSIEPLVQAAIGSTEESFGQELKGLALENIQSRIRGTLLYTRSNQAGSMVINTSNKSELAVGYSTQYGDSVGAISLLGDLYKSEVFQLANHLNKTRKGSIPQKVIDRPPSAELREDQKDEDSLPAYERLDPILELILTYQKTLQNIQALGFSNEEVQLVFDLYRKSEYKRAQFCPILKLKAKSFGFGYRVPISKIYQK